MHGGLVAAANQCWAAFCIYGLFCQGHCAVNETKRAIVFHSATAINYLKAYFLGNGFGCLEEKIVSQVIGTTPPNRGALNGGKMLTLSGAPKVVVEGVPMWLKTVWHPKRNRCRY